MKVVIVGAGISGLTMAIALSKLGHHVQVFEKSTLEEKTGMGVGLQPFAVDALFNLGLFNILNEGVLIQKTIFYTRAGDKIYEGSTPATRNRGKLGIRRPILINRLLDLANIVVGGNNIHSQHKLISFQQSDDKVRISIEKQKDHSKFDLEADLLIGADGLHSTVRSILFPDKNTINLSNIITWRGLTRCHNFTNANMIIKGDKFAKTVIYPVKMFDNNEVEYYWAAEVFDENHVFEGKPKNQEGIPDEFCDQFNDFYYNNIRLIDFYRRANSILKFPIVDKDPINTWFYGRAVLIGDAAHPMYPMGGNGASQSIIDALTLSKSLASTPTLQDAFFMYMEKRVNKVNSIVKKNRELGPDKLLVLENSLVDKNACHSIIQEYKELTSPTI